MIKKIFIVFFLMSVSNLFAQAFRNGPNGALLDTGFSCYISGSSCESLNDTSCSGVYGNWLFDPLDPPKICADYGNALVGKYCKLEKTFEDDELVTDQHLRFFLTEIPSGMNTISFMCANFGSNGPDGNSSARIVVQVGATKHFFEVPPFDPYVQWFPVEIHFCGKNLVEEVTISLDMHNQTESASVMVGIDNFASRKPENAICYEECPECSSLLLKPNEEYILSAWVKLTFPENYDYQEVVTSNYDGAYITISHFSSAQNGSTYNTIDAFPSGDIIDGWQRIMMPFETPEIYEEDMMFGIELSNFSGYLAFFDDIRIHPVKSNLKSFVYDQNTQKLMAELDENNYATFYEYDAEGGLVRVKKETEKGVFTIQETRSSNKKKPQK